LLLELLDRGAIWCGAVGLEDLDILICERRDLLLLDLIIGKLLLVLLPVLTRGGRLERLASYTGPADSTDPTMVTLDRDQSRKKE